MRGSTFGYFGAVLATATLLLASEGSVQGGCPGGAPAVRASYYNGANYGRDYYGPWERDGDRWYTCYWYKSDPRETEYRCHYIVHYPKTNPDKLFFYSPYSKLFYGYVDKTSDFHALAPEHRKDKISEIPTSAWSTEGYSMPTIPGSTDGRQIPRPPGPPQ